MRVLPFVAILVVSAAHAAPYGESSRSASVDLRAGAYQPRIDSAFSQSSGGGLPYERVFNNESPLMFLLNIEHHLFNSAGTLSVGLGAGYWSVEGEGISDGASDSTLFRVVPTQLQLTYRLDPWQESLPFVPVVRVGLDYNWWEIENGSGDTAKFPSQGSASGTTWGWHANLGIHLLLDFIDPEMASDFDSEAGVNSSYLVFEINYARISDFGATNSFRLGDTTFFTGLAFDL